MRKLVFCLLLICFLTGCAKKTVVVDSGPVNWDKVDFDFSNLNYNVASGIFFEILVEPEKYMNKSVKMTGKFNSQIYEGKRYYTAVIWDATGCCPTGLDFVPPENMIYPDDFPEDNEDVTVYGTMKNMIVDGNENLVFVADRVVAGGSLTQ